jgi:hypothetical protein
LLLLYEKYKPDDVCALYLLELNSEIDATPSAGKDVFFYHDFNDQKAISEGTGPA